MSWTCSRPPTSVSRGRAAPSTARAGLHSDVVQERRLRERVAHGVRRGTWRAVDTVQARLEPGAGGVVTEAEDVHLRDVRVAHRPAHDLGVHLRLMALGRHGHVLDACVPVDAARVDLPADLVEVQPEPLERRGLAGPGERVPDGLLHAVEVHETGVRPRIAL